MKNQIIEKSIKLASGKLNIPEPSFGFLDCNELTSKEITCIFNKENNLISFNSEWVMLANEIEILITTFHEVRHAYQFYSITNMINETQEKLVSWKYNFENYISPDNNKTEDVEYLLQPIEIDAIVWTHNTVFELFEVKTVIPEVIKNYILNNTKTFK